MLTAEYEGINSFLVGASILLLEKGVKRETRGYICWELPEPFLFKIKKPTARWITIHERKWNLTLPYAESLWIASGRNDLNFIKHYVKKLADFTDDGEFLRGAYGPRLRIFNGTQIDYMNPLPFVKTNTHNENKRVDQFYFVEQALKKDINTRQAIISLGDPMKDCFTEYGELKTTKDFPCTRSIQFMKNSISGKLDMTVYMRSNDILWGASAVNIFNYTFIQEYFAKIIDLEVGEYYHFVNNFHFYDKYKTKLEMIASSTNVNDSSYVYNKGFTNLIDFDKNILRLSSFEEKLRLTKNLEIIDLNDDFFNDWLKVLYTFHNKREVQFVNPILNSILN